MPFPKQQSSNQSFSSNSPGKSGPGVRDCTSVSSREDGGWAFKNDADLCGGIQCLLEGQVASCQRVLSLVLLLALYVQMLLSHLS